MLLYRFKFFNPERRAGSKLIDVYAVIPNLDIGASVVCREFNITANDISICLPIAKGNNILKPTRKDDNQVLFKADNGLTQLYIIEKDITKAKIRLSKEGYNVTDFTIFHIKKPFLQVSSRKKEGRPIYITNFLS